MHLDLTSNFIATSYVASQYDVDVSIEKPSTITIDLNESRNNIVESLSSIIIDILTQMEYTDEEIEALVGE